MEYCVEMITYKSEENKKYICYIYRDSRQNLNTQNAIYMYMYIQKPV